MNNNKSERNAGFAADDILTVPRAELLKRIKTITTELSHIVDIADP